MRHQTIRLDHDELTRICLEAGADDAGFVEMERPALEDQREGLRGFFPDAATVVVLAMGLNRPSLRSPARNLCS
jgi:hypothetical protein